MVGMILVAIELDDNDPNPDRQRDFAFGNIASLTKMNSMVLSQFHHCTSVCEMPEAGSTDTLEDVAFRLVHALIKADAERKASAPGWHKEEFHRFDADDEAPDGQ